MTCMTCIWELICDKCFLKSEAFKYSQTPKVAEPEANNYNNFHPLVWSLREMAAMINIFT